MNQTIYAEVGADWDSEDEPNWLFTCPECEGTDIGTVSGSAGELYCYDCDEVIT